MLVDVDVTLVEAARAGDQYALERLVEVYLPLVYNIVGRALGGGPDVDDVVQESMLRVVRGLPGLREPGGFRSWLVAVAMNQVREHRRSRVVAAGPLDGFEDVPDPGADFAELTVTELGLSGQRREVVQAATWLDTDDQELLALWWLVEAGHLTRAELVAAVQADAHNVTVRVGRMKAQLETARRVVRALALAPVCPGLSQAAVQWPGRPLGLWRKRFARHIRECPYCYGAATDLVPAERLLVNLALVPVPVALAALVLAAVRQHPAIPQAVSHRRRSRSRSHAAGHRLSLRAKAGFAVTLGVAVAGTVVFGLGGGSGPLRHTADPAAVRDLSAPVPTTAAVSPTASAAGTTAPAHSAVPASRRPSAAHPSTARAASASTATTAPPPPPPTTAAAAPPPPGVQSAADQVLALINQARAAQGVPALSFSSGLNTSAAQHDQTMADGCGLSHQCPGEPSLGARETAAGVDWNAAGENIGDGGPLSASLSAISSMAVGLTQDMLDEKPPDDGHRVNILDPGFHHIGISVIRTSGGTVYLTQDFSN
jgi:RNA polymerase sigma factor (sigma-70 family)